MTTVKHCKVTYKIIKEYNKIDNYEIIEINGKNYQLDYYPRPCKDIYDLYAVMYKGVRYKNRAKVLKYLNTL